MRLIVIATVLLASNTTAQFANDNSLISQLRPPGNCDECEIVKILQYQLQQMQDFNKCFGGVIFDKSCYKLLLTNGVRTTYADALALCKLNGGSLTAIESETIYEVLYDYVQRAWSLAVDKEQSNYVDVWLEMRYQNGELTLQSSEEPAPYARWFQSYPSPIDGHINIGFEVAVNPDHPSTNTGMFNVNPDYNAVPLCRFPIDS